MRDSESEASYGAGEGNITMLKYLELENFKSYRGHQRIGPFSGFTSIIGPNGSGKSNLMDAICFVLGERTKDLRVKKLSDLIHGAPIAKPVAKQARVTAVIEKADKTMVSFSRIIRNNASYFEIDDVDVSSARYNEELEKFHINVKAKNFLVMQGTVENIAMRTPKERTALFEEISKSGELKEEYDRLKAAMLKAEEDTQYQLQRKKGVNQERREAKHEQEEAEKYQKLKEEMTEKQMQLKLFKLFYNEKDMSEIKEELKNKVKENESQNNARQKIVDKMNDVKKQQGNTQRDMAKCEQQIRDAELELNKKKPQFIKAKEKTAHMLKKLDTAKKSRESARATQKTHEKEIKSLEDSLAKVKADLDAYNEMVEEESQSQGITAHLQESQVEEYHKLKDQAGVQAAIINQDLDIIVREQKNDQDKIDNDTRRKTELESKISAKESEKGDHETRLQKLVDYIEKGEKELAELTHTCEKVEGEVSEAKEKLDDLNKKLTDVDRQLSEAKVDKHETSRDARKKDLLATLKKNHSGVYGRLIDLCEPTHKKYNLAITKVMGKNMDAIIVDTKATGQECIKYMKEQRCEPETFLPLDFIEVSPLNERLRSITEVPNVKLVMDVITTNVPEMKKALLYACGNALVADNIEDARKLAFGLSQRHKSVSLDGTLFQKSGIISGGASELRAKARRWDDKVVGRLTEERSKIMEDLRRFGKSKRKEAELSQYKSQIKGLENRLKYTKQDRDSFQDKMAKDAQLEKYKRELETLEPKIAETELRKEQRAERIKKKKDEANTVEDRIFKDFCKQIGVENIRRFEEKQVRQQQERMKRRLDYENQINKINNQLEYEKSRDTIKSVQRWENMVKDDEKVLKDLEKEEQKHRKEIDEVMQKQEDLRNKKLHFKSQVDDFESEIAGIRKELNSKTKDGSTLTKQIANIESKLEQKKSDRHSLLKSCKMENINIPMKVGTMEDIAEFDLDATQEGGEEESASQEKSTRESTRESRGSAAKGRTSQPDNAKEKEKHEKEMERENRIRVDFDQLDEDFKDLSDREINKKSDELNKSVGLMQSQLQRFNAPNMRAADRMEEVKAKYVDMNAEFERARSAAKTAKMEFEKLRKRRFERFNQCFSFVSDNIDQVYKRIAQNMSAQALLGPENPEEPYLEGINYNCVAPGKRYRPMDNLSGGEKTVAALALLFAIQSYHPAPFFVLDEIDAALDNTNIGKVASFIRSRSQDFQCIVISLKEEFFNKGDALIGVYPEPGDCIKSNVLTLNLQQYINDEEDQED